MRSPMRCSASNRACSEAHSGRASFEGRDQASLSSLANPKTGVALGRIERLHPTFETPRMGRSPTNGMGVTSPDSMLLSFVGASGVATSFHHSPEVDGDVVRVRPVTKPGAQCVLR
jgi:hypothetical protein